MTGIPEKHAPAAVTVCNVVNDSPHKIFIGGIPCAIPPDKFMEIVGSFGVLKAYHFELNKDCDKPFAFLEYADHSITLKACAGLNGMKLGGSVLTVVQALPNTSREEIVAAPPCYGIPEHARPLLENPTQVLKLQNVFDEESFSLLSEPELEETLEDIRLECARFGTVKSMNTVKYIIKNNSIGEVADIHAVADFEGNSQSSSSDVEMIGQDAQHQDWGLKECMQDSSSVVAERQDVQDVELNDEEPVCEHKHNEHDEAGQQLAVARPEEPSLPGNNKDQNAVTSAGDTYAKLCDTNGNLEQTEGLQKTASPELGGTSAEQTDGSNIHQISDDVGGVFEEGCVLIEYARKEASCSAAHCLHGRMFGDRIVLAGYVPYDLYRAKFSSK